MREPVTLIRHCAMTAPNGDEGPAAAVVAREGTARPSVLGSPEPVYLGLALLRDGAADEFADIAIQTAEAGRALLFEEPRVAMLSFSTHGSASHPDVDEVIGATALVRTRRKDVLRASPGAGSARHQRTECALRRSASSTLESVRQLFATACRLLRSE